MPWKTQPNQWVVSAILRDDQTDGQILFVFTDLEWFNILRISKVSCPKKKISAMSWLMSSNYMSLISSDLFSSKWFKRNWMYKLIKWSYAKQVSLIKTIGW